MKKLLLALAISATFVSCGASATGKIDITNPFDHATRTELKAEATTRANADKNLQSQIDQKGYEINTQAKYTTSVNEDLQASKAAGVAAYGELKGTQGQQQTQINAVQGAAQTANDRASNLEVRADNVEGAVRETNAQVAVTDARSINNATAIKATNGVVAQHTEALQQNAAQWQVQSQVNNEYGTRLDAQDAMSSRFAGDIGNLKSQVAGMNDRINSADRKAEKALNAAAGALSVASIQFNTDVEAGFQVGAGIATLAGKNAAAVGVGGAVNKNWFVSGYATQAGSASGAAASVTYSMGR